MAISRAMSLRHRYNIRMSTGFMLSENTEMLRSNFGVRGPKRPNKTQTNTQKSMKTLINCQILNFL